MVAEKLKLFLLCLYVFPLSWWVFDVVTTYYAVVVLRVAVEVNPLGWPLGVLGALLFYVPALVFCYVLLFRFRGRLACGVAVLITVVALFLGVMNFGAGLSNIRVMRM
jgi:hypothetical protein